MTITDAPPTPDIPITDAPAEGPPPIWDSEFLLMRIAALDPERTTALAEAWNAQGIGGFSGLVTADIYRKVEDLVQRYEPTAEAMAGAQRLQVLHEMSLALPEHIRSACTEALSVYAGMADPTRWLLTSTGRLAEVERVVGEAVAYAATLPDVEVPSVADLPPVDDTAEQVASDEYPGPKADSKTVLAWVGEDRNKAARAFAHEQDRSTVRKGVIAKLTDVLGPDGLAKVEAALADAAPPPLDLSAGIPHVPAETAAAGPEAAPSEPSSGVASPAVEAAPAAATPLGTSVIDTATAVADALDQIAAGIVAIAYAVREGS